MIQKGSSLKRIFTGILFIVLLIWCIAGAAGVLQRKSSKIKYHDFFEQNEDFDVLLLGSSHMLDGVYPMELWKDYGITSYNLGGHQNTIPTTYWVMKNALDYTTPKLIVVDVYLAGWDAKVNINTDFIHLSFDSFPVTYTKYQAIRDLFDDKEAENYRTRWEYLWDFGKYHSRWNELTREDFVMEKSVEKGAETRVAWAMPENHSIISGERSDDTDTAGKQYLRKIIEDSQDRGIEVLLVHLPYPAAEEDQMCANSINKIAQEYGVDYIDFVQRDNVVDYRTDCSDSTSHLNPSGARKVTDFLGQYIKENYQITEKEQGTFDGWFQDYEEYQNYKYDILRAQDMLNIYLMLLADKNLSSAIFADESKRRSEQLEMLIRNLPDHREMEEEEAADIFEEIADINIVVTDRQTGELVDMAAFMLEGAENLTAGRIR